MLVEMRDAALELLGFSWPMVVISVIIATSLRIVYLINTKRKIVLYEEILMLAFIVYVLLLFQAVTFQDVSWSTHNYIPFKEIFRYNFGSYLFYKNILGNVLLFLPFGFFATKYTKTNKALVVVILSVIASLSIEVTQLIIGRVFDIDDILLNVIGALVGYFVYKIARFLYDKLPLKCKSDIVLDIVTILLVGGLIWFLIP